MSQLSRRKAIGGIAALPFAVVGLRSVLAQDDSTPEATPGGSPEASPGASPAASPMASPGAGAVVEVEMLDTFDFVPNEFEVQKGDTIRVINVGFLEHDFEVDEWEGPEMEGYALAGETADIIVPDDAEEGVSYEFYCTVAGHREGGMVGTVTVVAS